MSRDPQSSSSIHTLEWKAFQEYFSETHQQGESVALVGPTGSGKSILGLELCKIRARRTYANSKKHVSVVVLATKHRDATIESLGWPVLREWPPGYGQEACVIWPRPKDVSSRSVAQAKVMRHILNKIEDEGGHTIYIDEAAYFEESPPDGLGMSETMSRFWREARSNGISMIAGTQRPRRVSVSMWSEPAWICVFRVDDEEDLKRVAQLSGQKQLLLEVVPQLGGHEFICVHRPRAGQYEIVHSRVALSGRR